MDLPQRLLVTRLLRCLVCCHSSRVLFLSFFFMWRLLTLFFDIFYIFNLFSRYNSISPSQPRVIGLFRPSAQVTRRGSSLFVLVKLAKAYVPRAKRGFDSSTSKQHGLVCDSAVPAHQYGLSTPSSLSPTRRAFVPPVPYA